MVSARISAARSVNCELILLYWDIGGAILEKQKTLSWGASVVEIVAAELKRAFPGMTGFSAQNVWRMVQLCQTYEDKEFLAQVVREMSKRGRAAFKAEKLSQLVREMVSAVPWGHHAHGPAARRRRPRGYAAEGC